MVDFCFKNLENIKYSFFFKLKIIVFFVFANKKIGNETYYYSYLILVAFLKKNFIKLNEQTTLLINNHS